MNSCPELPANVAELQEMVAQLVVAAAEKDDRILTVSVERDQYRVERDAAQKAAKHHVLTNKSLAVSLLEVQEQLAEAMQLLAACRVRIRQMETAHSTGLTSQPRPTGLKEGDLP